jgi:hypothetical protein
MDTIRERPDRSVVEVAEAHPMAGIVGACQLEPVDVDVVDYGVNICVQPFDSKYPDRASKLSNWMEVHFGRRLLRLVHAGFLQNAPANLQSQTARCPQQIQPLPGIC